MTSAAELIEAARAVTIADAAERLGLAFARRGTEHPQPCSACGGRDRFSFNAAKNNWVCRGAAAGGGDAIGMAAHVRGPKVRGLRSGEIGKRIFAGRSGSGRGRPARQTRPRASGGGLR